jgi:PAS domain S-box-containing protein
VKLLANPVVMRAAIVLFCAGFAFVLGLVCVRLLRRRIHEEADISAGASPSLENLPLHLYNTVIQQLKQQKHELQVQTQAEQRRARTTENFSQAVLSNLSSGVLVFGSNGLVRQSNPAAKEILGFGSPAGMSADDIFRDTALASEIHSVLREGSKRRQVKASYTSPTGDKRHISVTVSPVPATDGSLLGAACLINDLSDLENIRRQQELQGEISAEMALELRTSLTTISGYAQQLAHNRDPEFARQLATDIAAEAARLDRTIGGFLTEKRPLRSMAAPANSANRG